MSFSDRLRSFLGDSGKNEPPHETRRPTPPESTPPAEAARPTPTPPLPAPAPALPEPMPPKPSPTLEELDRLIAQERRDGEARLQAVEKEIQGLRQSLEKVDASSKTRHDQQQQTLEYLQQDAEREIKFLERKLQ